MDNQHKKIMNYRDLTQAEIDMMNDIKLVEEDVLHAIESNDPVFTEVFKDQVEHLISTVREMDTSSLPEYLVKERESVLTFTEQLLTHLVDEADIMADEIDVTQYSQEMSIKTMFMWLVRSVALPTYTKREDQTVVFVNSTVNAVAYHESGDEWSVVVPDTLFSLELNCADVVYCDECGKPSENGDFRLLVDSESGCTVIVHSSNIDE